MNTEQNKLFDLVNKHSDLEDLIEAIPFKDLDDLIEAFEERNKILEE